MKFLFLNLLLLLFKNDDLVKFGYETELINIYAYEVVDNA